MNSRFEIQAQMDRQWQLDYANGAALKLQMLGLTPKTGMDKCKCPKGINAFRWKAMVTHAFKILSLEKGNL